MWFAGLAAGNTYGIIWTPSRGQYKLPVAVQPLVGLTAAGKDNCCEYTVSALIVRCFLLGRLAQPHVFQESPTNVNCNGG